MVVCFLCGSTNNISNVGFKKLHSLQTKSSDSMKCVLNNLTCDSGIIASDKDVVCLNCEALCRELDMMEYERLIMRKILRRLIHSTNQVNNLDRNLCQLDHKALSQFRLNGSYYFCKICDFKTKRFAHITPHHTIHQIQNRRAVADVKSYSDISCKLNSELNLKSVVRGNGNLRGSELKPESVAQENEIFEFNIDCNEGDCLYSMEDVSIKFSNKEKNDEFEYDLYYPEDCESEKTEKGRLDSQKKILKTANADCKTSIGNNITDNEQDLRCRRLDYLYALHCGCSHCEQLPLNPTKQKSPTQPKKEFMNNCPTCNQTFVQESTYHFHTRMCRIKSALKFHRSIDSNTKLKSKNNPLCSKWLDEKRRLSLDDEGDDFYDLEAVDIDEADMKGNIFDEKFELFLRKSMMRLNTIDIEFVPI